MPLALALSLMANQGILHKKQEELLGAIKTLEAQLAAQKAAASAPKAAETKEVQGNLLLNLGGQYAPHTVV